VRLPSMAVSTTQAPSLPNSVDAVTAASSRH
jgi:hypothetical protein